MRKQNILTMAALALCITPPLVYAQVSAEKAAELGGDKYTCIGAIRAGTDDGVAKYTGKYDKTWPGLKKDHGYTPGPFADEKPLFTITASNMDKYEDKLTEGEKALLKKYPDIYKMKVYPSHRDFKIPEYACETEKKNATQAKIIDGGLGVDGFSGAPPFPFPKSGIQGIWNVINPVRAWTEEVTYDTADVYSNGSITWGRVHFKTLNPGNNPESQAKRGKYTDKINAYFFQQYLLPARNKGEVAVGFQPNGFKDQATQAWQYQPGIRRVRKAPEVGFDFPIPPAGLRTTDSDYVFNGSPERYNWKLIGKKEVYVPYNNFKVNDPSISYKDLVKTHTLNPDYIRYELHRVWVIEGDLKDGVRNINKKRVIYADEDNWLAITGDNYDERGELWRVPMVLYFYSQESGTYHRGVSLYHNLTSGAYEATYLVNERGADDWWRVNQPLKKKEFSPDAAQRAGQ